MLVSALRSICSRRFSRRARFLRFNSGTTASQLSSSFYESISNNCSIKARELPSASRSSQDEFDRNKVIAMLNMRNPNVALSFFRQLKEAGFVHDMGTYAVIIRILSCKGLDMKLDSLLCELIGLNAGDRGFEIFDLLEEIADNLEFKFKNSKWVVRAFGAFVKAYVSFGMFGEAVDILFQTKRLGIVPDIRAGNFLLNRLFYHREVDACLAFYVQMKSLGLNPNHYTYTILIKALCGKCSFVEAKGVLQEMKKAGISPLDFAYSTLIEGLCSHQRSYEGFQLLLDGIEEGVSIGSPAYHSLIRGFGKEMNLEAVETVVSFMVEQGLVFDVNAYGALIGAYTHNGDVYEASTLHDDMLDNGIKTNCVIVSFILQRLYQLGCFCRTVEQFKRFRASGIFLDQVCYNIVVNALCKLENIDEAVYLLCEMKAKKMVMDDIHYTTLIDGYFLQGKHGDAWITFNEMIRKGIRPDIITYNVLIGGLCKNGCTGVDFLAMIMKQGLEPNAVTHNNIIEGLCIGGNVKEAEAFFNSLEDKSGSYSAMVKGYCEANKTIEAFTIFVEGGNMVSRSSCFILLNNLCRMGYPVRAFMLLDAMASFGVAPRTSMYGQTIAAFCRAGDVKKARKVFDISIRRGLTSNIKTFTMMIDAYCKENCLQEANDLYCQMRKRGIYPDLILYTALLDGYSEIEYREGSSTARVQTNKKVKMEVSAALSEIRENIELDVICYTVYIDLLCKRGGVEKAVSFIDKMLDEGLQPDIVTYTALLGGYRKIGDIDAAKKLVEFIKSKGIQLDERARSCINKLHKKMDPRAFNQISSPSLSWFIRLLGIRKPVER